MAFFLTCTCRRFSRLVLVSCWRAMRTRAETSSRRAAVHVRAPARYNFALGRPICASDPCFGCIVARMIFCTFVSGRCVCGTVHVFERRLYCLKVLCLGRRRSAASYCTMMRFQPLERSNGYSDWWYMCMYASTTFSNHGEACVQREYAVDTVCCNRPIFVR